MTSTPDGKSPSASTTSALYRRYGAAVRRWALRLTRSPADAEDIVQEVFLVAHRRLSGPDSLGSPGSWLFRVTRNVARHLWRERRRVESVQLDEVSELVDLGLDPFQALERRVDIQCLTQALGHLCREDQRLVYLCDVRRLPTSRVTDLTGIKAQTMRVRRYRARRRIARWMQQLEPVWALGA